MLRVLGFGFRFRIWGLGCGVWGFLIPIMENQMDKKMEDDVDTGINYIVVCGIGGLVPKMGCTFWGSL